MDPAFCVSFQSQHKFKFILFDNHANISRNKVARAKVLEFIDHPSTNRCNIPTVYKTILNGPPVAIIWYYLPNCWENPTIQKDARKMFFFFLFFVGILQVFHMFSK